jgi:competence protein ComEA
VPSLPIGLRQRRLVLLAALALVAIVVAWRHAAAGAPAGGAPLAVAPLRPRAATTRQAAAAAPPIVVDVVGAVRRPGLYRLRRGARVADAVARAGGLTRRAQRTAVNLAAPLADGQQVLVAARGAAVVGAVAAGAPASGPVSLSTATAEQLDTLPGVGPVTAQKIVAYREQHGPFTAVAQLDAIPGIGPSRLDELKGLVVP